MHWPLYVNINNKQSFKSNIVVKYYETNIAWYLLRQKLHIFIQLNTIFKDLIVYLFISTQSEMYV